MQICAFRNFGIKEDVDSNGFLNGKGRATDALVRSSLFISHTIFFGEYFTISIPIPFGS